MRARTILFTVFLVTCNAAPATSPIPQDVQSFIRNADTCDHMAGEFDGSLSDKRQREIERSIVKYCRPAQQQLKLLKLKYKNEPRVLKVIQSHAYDAVISFR